MRNKTNSRRSPKVLSEVVYASNGKRYVSLPTRKYGVYNTVDHINESIAYS